MSVIEQAAKRLEELRKAGILIPRSKFVRDEQSAVFGGGQHDGGLAERKAKAHPPVEPAPGSERPAEPGRGRATSKTVSLDLPRLGALGLVTPADPQSQIAEEFRSIKRPLIRNAQGKGAGPIENGNLIMVTSALPGEGKSTCAVNLAISVAMELDNTVLLVDADVAKPAIPAMLGISTDLGLLDAVVDSATDLSKLLLRTNIDKLSLLPSGRPNARATELLASETTGRLLDEMSSRYADRIIVFDSPPLLLTNEARALAAHMGQVVVVVEAERTAQAALKQALAAIEVCPVKLLLLNKSRSRRQSAYYGYGHYGRGEHAHYGYGG